MRLSVIPSEQIEAIQFGTLGFKQAIDDSIEAGLDPDIEVIRVVPNGEVARWYIRVSCELGYQQFVADKNNIAVMAAVAPIYLVELVQSVRSELAAVFSLDGFEEGVRELVPFECNHRNGKPS